MAAFLRAALYLGILLLLGAGVFARWVGPELLTGRVRSRLRAGLVAGGVLVIVGSALEVAYALSQAIGAFDPAQVPVYLTETRHGNAVLIRVALVVLLAALGLGWDRFAAIDRVAYAVLGVGVLVTFSQTSHAAGVGGMPPPLADLAHLAGVAAWGGALIYVAWLPIWPAQEGAGDLPAAAAVHRVSTVGLISALVIVATGVYAAFLQLWGPPALTGTPYGLTLLYKLGAVMLIFAIASVNRWTLVPALMARNGAARTLVRLMRLESVLLLTVLGLTGLLISRGVPEPPGRLATASFFEETVGTLSVHGSLMPSGANGFTLHFTIHDIRDTPIPTLNVGIVLTMQDHPMPPMEVLPTMVQPGSYHAVVPLPMAGRWQVAIRLPSGVVRVPVQAKPIQAGWPMPDWRTALPGVLPFLLGLSVFVGALKWVGLRARAGWALVTVGTGLVILGAFILLRTPFPLASSESGPDRPNPIPGTKESIAMGERTYRDNCQVCHGASGAGDGPAAATLNPRPADFRVHLALGHSDAELFQWISEGFPGTAMPAFKEKLTESDRWRVIHFIRTFAGKGGPAASAPPPPSSVVPTSTAPTPATSPAAPGPPIASSPPRASAPAAAPPAGPKAANLPGRAKFHVQAGAFTNREYASDLARHLQARGYSATLVEGRLIRVWVGPPMDREAAERLAAKLRSNGFEVIMRPAR